jgi:hypothetical protein
MKVWAAFTWLRIWPTDEVLLQPFWFGKRSGIYCYSLLIPQKERNLLLQPSDSAKGAEFIVTAFWFGKKSGIYCYSLLIPQKELNLLLQPSDSAKGAEFIVERLSALQEYICSMGIFNLSYFLWSETQVFIGPTDRITHFTVNAPWKLECVPCLGKAAGRK